jgi:hypothetical protein
MKKTLLTIVLASSQAFGGSGMSGGTPPAIKDLEQILNLSPELDGGLYELKGDLGLLTKTKLQQHILVSVGSSGTGTPPLELDAGTGGVNPPALRFSPEDVRILRDWKKPVGTVGPSGGNLSYEVSDGDTLDSVILKDRRMLIREATQ